jgi:hypothetical protein
MSNPTSPNQPRPKMNPEAGLVAVATEHLAALFEIDGVDHTLAKRMALSALYAYEPETRADFLNAARTIAFSVTALALLRKAASQGMTFPEQMRVYSRANALNRSANQSERTMMQRRREQKAHQPDDQPAQQRESPATQNGAAEIRNALAAAMKEYQAVSPPAVAPPAKPAPEKAAVRQPEVAALATAVRTSIAMPQAGQPIKLSFKEMLLRQTAIYNASVRMGAEGAPNS